MDIQENHKEHVLKTDHVVFQDVLDGNKTFEIRFNDREYQVGDLVILKETEFTGEQMKSGQPLVYTGREIQKRISYVLSGYGLHEGWVILGIQDIKVIKAQAVPEYAEFYLGGGVFAICDWKDYETVKNFKWNTSSRQSRTQWVWAHDPKNADINRRKVAMHNLIMCPPEGLYVDHINGNGLDNRRSNLRIVTKQQNTFNSAHKGGTSKYKGVCLEKESGMWKAYITKDGKKKSIGRFALEDDAARAYDKEAISLFREHAKLNFLPKAMIEAQEQNQWPTST